MVTKTVASDHWFVTSRFRRVTLFLLLVTLHSSLLFGQQAQAQAGQPLHPMNVKYVQGVGPGYWPTAGSNLTLNIAAGTAVCNNTVQSYAGGTLTLTASATNYVFLGLAGNCAPASNTTGFTTGNIPIATVVTNSSAISAVTDVRTMFVANSTAGSGTVTSVGFTGDGILFNSTVSGSPVTSNGTLAPQLHTQAANTLLAGPGSGSAATPTFRALVSADLPATISSNTSGNAANATALAAAPALCGTNGWATGISANGNAYCSQPAFSNLSGTASIAQGGTGQTSAASAFNALSPLGSEGDLLYFHSSSNSRLGVGASGQCLTSNGTDPAWGSCSGSINSAWSSLASPLANLTLSMSTYSTAFNQASAVNWTWANTTAATSSAAQSSPLLNLSGTYWNGLGSASDNWSFQDVVGNGSNGSSTLTLAHSGSSGAASLSVPNLTITNTTEYGVLYAGGASLPEQSTAAGPSGLPLLGQGSAAPAFGTLGVAGGGTGQSTAAAAFNALSPLTTEGDLHYYHSGGNTRLGIGANGQCLTSNGTDPAWGSCSAGSGTVTSVGLAMPSIFSVSGSPVTGSGTLTATLALQNANWIFAGPSSGSAAAPAFRALVGSDLPAPSTTALGGVESLICAGGQFLNQISTSGVPSCGIPSSSGSGTGLGNSTTVIDASLEAGATFDAKVNAAYTACPSQGCVIDARGLAGNQTLAASVNLTSQPVTLIMASGLTLTRSSGAQFVIGSNVHLTSAGSPEAMVITGSDSVAAIQATSSGADHQEIDHLQMSNAGTGPCINDLQSGGGVTHQWVHNNVFQCKTGLVITGYYNMIWENYFGFAYAGIVATAQASSAFNSNHIFDNRYGGSAGTGVFQNSGYSDKYDGGEDCENVGVCYAMISGGAVTIDGPYAEAVGSNVPAWASSTYYGLGALVHITSGEFAICTTAGTSGASAPSWPSEGASVADGAAAWTVYCGNGGCSSTGSTPYVLLGTGAQTTTVKGQAGQNAIVRDENLVINGSYTNTIDLMPNSGWGVAGYAPSSRTVLPSGPGYLFGTFNSTYEGGTLSNSPWVSLNANGMAGSSGRTYWGLEEDFYKDYCTATGNCGHSNLHVGTLVPAAGITSYGPVSLSALPTPNAPAVTPMGTNGSTSYTYYVVAHCNNAVTLPSSGTTITNGNATLSSTSYNQIQVPATFTSSIGSLQDMWSGCSWDILKGNTSTSLATNQMLPGGIYNDQGGATSAYAAPARNTTGDATVAGKLTTAHNILDDGSGNVTLTGASLQLGTSGGEGSLQWASNGTNSYFGIYDADNNHVYYGLAPQFPLPPGMAGLGGFYSGVGVGGTTANTGVPIFGVMNSAQNGSSGSWAFVAYDNNKIGTNHNTLDDGSGNMTVAGKATATQFCVGSNCMSSVSTLVQTNQANTYTSGDKQTFGATTASAASLNLPAGTAPTSPAAGDQWFDGDRVYAKDGETNAGVLSSVPRRFALTSAVTASSTTAVTLGTFAVAASKTYCLMCQLFIQSSSTSNKPTLLVNCPSNPTASQFGFVYLPTATSVAEAGAGCGAAMASPTATGTAGTTLGGNSLTGMLQNGSTAGSLTFQVESSGSYNTIIEPGSYCILY